MFDLRGGNLKLSPELGSYEQSLFAIIVIEASVAVYNHCKDAKPGEVQTHNECQ